MTQSDPSGFLWLLDTRCCFSPFYSPRPRVLLMKMDAQILSRIYSSNLYYATSIKQSKRQRHFLIPLLQSSVAWLWLGYVHMPLIVGF